MSFRKIWGFLWLHIKKHQGLFYATFLFYAGVVLFDSIIKTIYFKKIIDFVSNSFVDRILHQKELFFLVFINIMILVGGNICSRLGGWFIVKFQVKVIKDLNDSAFEKLQEKSYRFFMGHFIGSLVTKTRRLARSFEAMHDLLIYSFWMTFISLLGSMIVLFYESKKIAFAFLIWILFYMLISLIFIKIKIKLDIAEAEADSKVGGRLADVLTNIFTVKIFSGRKKEIKEYKDITKDEAFKKNKAWVFNLWQDAIQAFLMLGIQAFVLWKLVQLWVLGGISAGMFVLVQTYMLIIFDRLWHFGKDLSRFMKYTADAKEAVDILTALPDIIDVENPEKCLIKNGEIVFNNIDFKYIDGKDVFQNFYMKIKNGEKIGLVGYSGSGKTTIMKLLLRFSDVQKGDILIDDQDIKKITQDDLRSKISYVPQEPILFHRSIRENITYGKLDATEEEIIEVSKKAHAYEFISTLPQEYDTKVGERGIKLSGGERQRVVIARAMLKNAPILILDEATSSLDSVSESYIQDAFNELMKGKTTIVIAHRLSTVQKMDRIIVLDKGKIIEEGTHKELLKGKGIYADLWSHQTGGFLE